jgi:transposase
MRGKDEQQLDVFSYISPEQRVPRDHPLRSLRAMTDEALRDLQPRFNKLYAKTGRPSIAPERLLRALLLQALYSVRSERLLMEQLDYNLLFRWFVGLNMDDAIWDVTVFTKNRERLLDGNIAEAFFQAVLQQARERSLLSDEHFTVDGTLLEAWASVKSYQRKDAKNAVPPDDPGNATVDFHGEKRSNQTHASKTDPDAKMARKGKGKEAKLSYNGNLLVENRHGLIVNTEVFEANGTAERDAALVMLEQIPGTKQVTVGGDKAYDTADFVAECRNLKVTPHVAQNLERPGGSAIDARTTSLQPNDRRRASIAYCSFWLSRLFITWYGEDCRTYRMALRERCCDLISSLIASSPVSRDANWIARPNTDEQLRQKAYHFEACGKHKQMRKSPFLFFRGTFYRWAQLWPEVCANLRDAPKVLAVGDLHVGSFGTWRDTEGRLSWGVDDFDESYPYSL